MSVAWRTVTVADVAAASRNALVGGPFGSDLVSRDYVEAGVPVIRGTNLSGGRWVGGEFVYVTSEKADALAANCAVPNDLVFTQRGTLGQVALVPESGAERYLISQSQMKLTVDPDAADPLFLYYVFSSGDLQEYIRLHAIQTGVPHINLGILRETPVPCPPVDMQRGIAATLGALDDKIESNRRTIDVALRLARAQVEAATNGRGLGPLGEWLTVAMGSAFKGAGFSAPGVGRPLLRIRDLKTFESQTWTVEQRPDEVVIHPGDIVVGMDAEFRATLWLGEDSVLNQRVCSFTGRGEVGRAFVLAALEPQLAFQEGAKSGTTVIHLNRADIDTFRVPRMSDEEHHLLAVATEPLIDLVVAKSQETRKVAALRDALLPELLSGRIRVPEAAEALTDATA